MLLKSVKVQAPSSTMLFGEHAVLRGKTAIVVALNKHISVALAARSDDKIIVNSILQNAETTLQNKSLPHSLKYIQGCLAVFSSSIRHGFTCDIVSEVPHTVGLGSSASVTAAMCCALLCLFEPSFADDKEEILRRAIAVIKYVQGFGSGADVAASIYGGVISYCMATKAALSSSFPATVSPIHTNSMPIQLIYCGYKTPTPDVIRFVNTKEQQFPKIYQAIFNALEEITICAKEAMEQHNISKIGTYMDMAQGLMESIGVTTRELSSILWAVRSLPGIYGAKISGSGLGDSVIALGSCDQRQITQGRYIEAQISSQGVTILGKEM